MLERLSKTHRNLALAALAALLLWFGWTVRSVLNPLILGYLFAYILRPMVQKLQDRGMGRRLAVNIIFFVFGALVILMGGAIVLQGRQFVEDQVVAARQGDDLFTKAERTINVVLNKGIGKFGKLVETDGVAAPEDLPPADASAETPAGASAETPAGASAETPADSGDETPTETQPETSDGPLDQAEVDAGTDPADASGELNLRNLVRESIASWSKSLGDEGISKAQVAVRFVQRVFGDVMGLFVFLMLLPVYTYFLLFELERIHEFVRSHVPKRERDRVARIGRSVGSVIANFFRGRLLICLLKGLILAIGLMVLGVPYGFLLGILSGFLALVPFAGPTIGFVLTFLVSLQKVSPNAEGILLSLALLGGLYALAEIVEGYVFIPKILGDTLGLHPVVILLSVFVGGAALGLFGFLMAIPLAATLIILFKELVMPALEDFAEEDTHVGPASPVAEIAGAPKAGSSEAGA